MGHTDLGVQGSAQSKTAGTSLTITNSTGAIIPAGTFLFLTFTCDNASATVPTLTLSSYTGGGTWATNKVTSIGHTATAGSGIHHFTTWVKTTTNIAAGATIVVATLSASVVAKAALINGFTGVGTLKNSGSTTTASGLGGSSSLGMIAGTIAVGDVLIESQAQELATLSVDGSTVNGVWSTPVTIGTSGGSAVTNVVTSVMDKDSTGTSTWSSTSNNISGDQSIHGYVFAAAPTLSAPPVARAGNDQTVQRGATVTLNGTTSTDDVAITSYSWSQIGGSAVTLTNANTATATFTAPSVTAAVTLTFRLTVTDADSQTSTDDIVVTVRSNPPVAAAGNDQTVVANATVNLSGAGSTDDGGVTGYSWAQIGGTAVTLTGAATSTPSFTAPATASTLTFRLTVTDVDGQTSTDDVVVTVKVPPVAAAGNDQTVVAGTTVNLSGSGSSDDVGISSYSWAYVPPAGAVSFSDDFNRADTAGAGISGSWTSAGSVAANRLQIVSNQVTGSPASAWARHSTVTNTDDQFAQTTYLGQSYNGLLLGCNGWALGTSLTAMAQRWYHIRVEPTTSILTVRIKDASLASFTLLYTSSNAVAIGDVIRAEYVAGVLYVYVNGVFKFSHTPVVVLTGQRYVGLGINAAASNLALFDNFSGGDYFAAPLISLTGPSTATPSFTAPQVPGTYTFRLTVTDTDGLQSTDDVVITVTAVKPPVANAGVDQSVTAGSPVTLTGAASTDDVGISSWLWTYLGSGVQLEDDFNRPTEDLGVSGGSWRTSATAATSGRVIDNTLQGNTSVFAARHLTPTTAPKVFAQATFLGGNYVGPCVAMNAFDESGFSAVLPHYCFRAGAGSYQLVAKDAPAATTYTVLATHSVGPAAGDVMRIEYDGTTIQCFLNGSLVLTNNPASPISLAAQPYVGLVHNLNSQPGVPLMDTWSGGDIVASDPAVTLSGSTTSTATFTPPVGGVYQFRLTVTDTAGLKSMDDTVVTAAPGVTSFEGWGIPI